MLQDFRYALRMLRATPALTAVIILSLAIGIGANSAIFSVVDALLLRPLPYPQPERLANIWLHSPGIGILRDWPSPGQYIDIRKENHSFDEMSISRLSTWILTGRDQPQRVDGMRSSSSLLRMLGAKPLFGRLLLPEEDAPGKPVTAVLSYGLWQRLFNSDPKVIGTNIQLNGRSIEVVGVLRPEFRLNTEVMPSEGPMDKVDIFMPFPLGPDAAQARGDENYNLLVRLKPGVTVKAAQADIDIIASRIREKDKRDRTYGMTVVGLLDQVVGNVRRALLVLLGSVALVLLCACVNVANILLTRSAARERQIAIRTALGAGWQRLIRQLLTESILLSLLGAGAGLLLAKWSLQVMRAINPGNIPRLEEIGINPGVLLFTVTMALITGVLFGLAPAWQAMKVDLNTSLKSGGRGVHTGGLRVTRHRLRGLLVVSELALSLMLLVGAGLLFRSFVRLQQVPPGFRTDHVLTMQVSPAGERYRDQKARIQFYDEVAGRVTHLPSVVSEGLISTLPLTGAVGWGGIGVEGYHPEPGQELQVDIRIASEDYFRTMDIPIRQGRAFDTHDTVDGQPAAIVDDRFAKRFWPNETAVGKHVWFDEKKPKMTIVGVVGTVKQYGLDDEGKIAAYFPYRQMTGGGMYLVARTSADPSSLSGAAVREIHALDPDVAVTEVRTMNDRLYSSVARQRFSTTMLGAFAVFALILAAIGIYGVMSYLVSQGTHDIGVRVALGAQRSNIISMVMRQGMELAVIGIVAGLIGAAILTRVMASLLFGVSATDALTFSAVAVVLAAIAFVATYVPALRATRVDPIVALREE
jgi:predicted permease